jgi:threonine/homoserine/homoserine lactone efflux protein
MVRWDANGCGGSPDEVAQMMGDLEYMTGRPLRKTGVDVVHLGTIVGFIGVSFIAVAMPGPDMILAMTNGSRFGLRRALPGMLAVLLCDLIMIAGVAAGLGALLAASVFWFAALKYVGAGYLAYLGIVMLRSRGRLSEALQTNTGAPAGALRSIAVRSFLVAVTNPKSYLFFSALLPQFIHAAAPQTGQYFVLASVFVLTEFVIMVGYALAGRRAARILESPKIIWLERICGGALLASAASLTLARRAAAAS